MSQVSNQAANEGREAGPSGIPIPVELAYRIGVKYRKQLVIVTAYDAGDGRFFSATWGLTAPAKEYAAVIAPKFVELLGGGPPERVFKDFRNPGEAALLAETANRLLDMIADLLKLLSRCSQHVPELLRAQFLEACLNAARVGVPIGWRSTRDGIEIIDADPVPDVPIPSEKVEG